MIKNIINWFKDNREWKKYHLEAWSPVTDPDENGITPFQKKCLKALTENVQKDGISCEGNQEKFYTGIILGTNIRIYVYSDGAEISSDDLDFRLEKWDFKTPDELINQFIEKAKTLKI